jgi:DNA-binding transcriptional LysR family regulator
MDLHTFGLRVFREVSERGTFTAAAASLGYSQSAVSRQVAALESAVGAALFVRSRAGIELTAAGRALMPHAVSVIDAVDTAATAMTGSPVAGGRARLGAFPSAGPGLVTAAVMQLRSDHPTLEIFTREAPSTALVRALRAGSLDIALVASSPPFRWLDDAHPPLEVTTLAEKELLLAVPASHWLAGRQTVDITELDGLTWIGSRATFDPKVFGVWPGLAPRQPVRHIAPDWHTKLSMVASGLGVTTLPFVLSRVLPEGVTTVAVRGGSRETRRVSVARLPDATNLHLDAVEDALRVAVARL